MAVVLEVHKIGNNRARITKGAGTTGLVVAHGGGTKKIGFLGDATADVQLPWGPFIENGVAVDNPTLDDRMKVIAQAEAANTHGLLIRVTKGVAGGNPWQVTITNDDINNDTPPLEVFVEYAHSAER